MKTINLSEQNSVMNRFMAEIRDINYQQNRLLFRKNIERIGEYMAFEISKALTYADQHVVTPLGELNIPQFTDEIVVATVLRAGLPFHQGFLNVFDHADNAFISAFRMYTNREHTEVGVHTEYIASPSVEGKTLIIVDPMLATGGSMAAAYEAFLKTGKPKCVHIACVIGTEEGISVVEDAVKDADVTLWCAAIDPGMNEHKYIVPGFGDCGDLCYGEKL
ncbi:MAG: uracil phosphoribosyltransferase [Prevotella sp.]|nr:uracil phosphoribosyltransferase [Prevotella sp.]MBR5036319.1 uracil phosphoribosyltransferase [Prevotella sp.]MBR5698722.1 uracil phosphoribosyltransferase [Prevotella sp.]